MESVRELITLCRRAVSCALRDQEISVPRPLRERFSQRRGLFTTLQTFPDRRLRGCVGFPTPEHPLWEAAIRASVRSALRDPRFPPLKEEELESVVWELSVLTEPEEIEADPALVEVGVHGLLVEKGSARGLLLPQVAPRYRWTPEEFLSQTCLKAGLDRESWREKGVKIYRFRADIFEEVEPWGEVKRVLPE